MVNNSPRNSNMKTKDMPVINFKIKYLRKKNGLIFNKSVWISNVTFLYFHRLIFFIVVHIKDTQFCVVILNLIS